jgi:hypothetical protein
MKCQDMKSMGGNNTKVRWDITIGTGKYKQCNNNCRDCPNKQSSKVTDEVSQVEK